MREPRIQYAQTKDGVSIAFWTLGEGMPLVTTPMIPWSHIQLEWQTPEQRRWAERTTQTYRSVRYDGRGSGLSERSVTDFSLDAHILDLEAVVDCLGLESFALLGSPTSGPVAIAYAARHPDRVSHLILWSTYARAADFFQSPQGEALIGLLNKDWQLFTETVAHAFVGWGEDQPARKYAALMREAVTPETARAAVAEISRFDVTDIVSDVKAPTLVLHRREAGLLGMDTVTWLAGHIPDARLLLLEGTSVGSGRQSDVEETVRAFEEFMGLAKETLAPPKPLAGEDIHTVLFTDVEGSTALTQRLGDAKARELLREHERMVREALKSHGGSEVKTMGDGFMASFSSATRALECAIAMQRAFAEHNETAPEPVRVRVGLNAGEPITEEEDLFGTAVNRAARIAALAQGGEILAANVVRELAEGKEFMFGDRGETALRGFDDPVRLWEVRWTEG